MINIEVLKRCERHRNELQDRILRNISDQDITEYEALYHAAIDPNYSVNRWCGDCVADLVTRCWNWFAQEQAKGTYIGFQLASEIVISESQCDEEPTSKRPKKK